MSIVKRFAPGCLALGGVALAVLVGVTVWAASTADTKLAFPDTPGPSGLAATTDPDAIARGRYLAHGPAHCSQCHSEADRDHPERTADAPLHGGLAFEMGPLGTFYARNLTSDAKTGIGRYTDAELARALRTGVMPDGRLSVFMRYSGARLSDADIVDVLSYLRSTAPIEREVPPGELTLLGKAIVKLAFPEMTPRTDAPTHVAAALEPTVERGRYLADDVMLCTACHTGFDPATFEPVGPKGGGGSPEASHGADADMEFCPPNLTSHPTGITGRLDEDAFLARVRAGRGYPSSLMPWEQVQRTSEADLRSVYRYLRTLPPIDADTGPTYRPVGWAPAG